MIYCDTVREATCYFPSTTYTNEFNDFQTLHKITPPYVPTLEFDTIAHSSFYNYPNPFSTQTNITFFFDKSEIISIYYHFYYISPVYNLNVDFKVSKKSSVGIAVSYQYLKDVPIAINIIDSINYPILKINDPIPNETVSRLNLALRYTHSIPGIKNKRIEAYWGIRMGFSCWKDNLASNNTEFKALIAQYEIENYPELSHPFSMSPSFQFLGGIRFFATPHVAFHLEVGLGTPYLLDAGVTYALDIKGAKK